MDPDERRWGPQYEDWWQNTGVLALAETVLGVPAGGGVRFIFELAGGPVRAALAGAPREGSLADYFIGGERHQSHENTAIEKRKNQ